jgi:hypothetical protein
VGKCADFLFEVVFFLLGLLIPTRNLFKKQDGVPANSQLHRIQYCSDAFIFLMGLWFLVYEGRNCFARGVVGNVELMETAFVPGIRGWELFSSMAFWGGGECGASWKHHLFLECEGENCFPRWPSGAVGNFVFLGSSVCSWNMRVGVALLKGWLGRQGCRSFRRWLGVVGTLVLIETSFVPGMRGRELFSSMAFWGGGQCCVSWKQRLFLEYEGGSCFAQGLVG